MPEKIRDEILSQRDMDILKAWFKAAARADSLEEWERVCTEKALEKARTAKKD